MKKISLLHPFTPKAAGVVEKSVPTYHSQPHLLAMQELSNRGYNCTMDYFTSKLFKYSFKKENIRWNFFPVSFNLNGDYKKWKKQFSKSCMNAYKKDTPDVTIINMSGHSSPFSYELSKIILDKKKRYIAMLGGLHYSDNEIDRRYYKNTHHILVHTYLQKREMESMELFKGKDIRVFPLGVDCDVFTPSKNKNTSPNLLYVGRIVELKRIHLAIEAVKMLIDNGFKEAVLNIIGPVSSQNYYSKLKKKIVDLGLIKNVFFLGHKEHGELPSYFQEANLFTLPSDKETFGMVMIEAMACGTPVAGIDCLGGPADVITNNVNGILSTPQNYAPAILNYFKNKEQQLIISKNARKTVLEKYSIKVTYQVLKSSVEDALK